MQKAIEIGRAKYPIKRVVCKTFTIPRGKLDFSQENVFAGQLPTRLVIGMVDNDAYNGGYGKNPLNFKHYNLTQIKIYLDSQQQYVRPLEPNFTASQTIQLMCLCFREPVKFRRMKAMTLLEKITLMDIPFPLLL